MVKIAHILTLTLAGALPAFSASTGATHIQDIPAIPAYGHTEVAVSFDLKLVRSGECLRADFRIEGGGEPFTLTQSLRNLTGTEGNATDLILPASAGAAPVGTCVIAGKSFEKGMAVRSSGANTWLLDSAWEKLFFTVGALGEAVGGSTVEVWGDGKRLWRSNLRRPKSIYDELHPVSVSVKGVRSLSLVSNRFFAIDKADTHPAHVFFAEPKPTRTVVPDGSSAGIGGWEPAKVSQEWKSLEWPVPLDKLPALKAVSFRFTDGNHRLDIRKVELLADGKILASSDRPGTANTPENPVIYPLAVPSGAKAEASCLIRAFVRTDGGTNSTGTVSILTDQYPRMFDTGDGAFSIVPKIPADAKQGNFHGYTEYDFTLNGRNCRIVLPKQSNARHSWVWRTEFWGHEPQTDIALLGQGFHIAFIDTFGLNGSPLAVPHWEALYDFAVKAGLNRKAALLGFSRGGLYAYTWATAHPDRVTCVYGDAPVLDIRSWPGGKGKGKGSPGEWQDTLRQYNLTEESAKKWSGPLDRLQGLAKAGVPLIHVVGDKDDLVPVEENTAILEQRYRKLGGRIQVIHKENCGHHPHSLSDPAPMVRFILRADYLDGVRSEKHLGAIWCVGDSITQSNCDGDPNGSSRKSLHDALAKSGFSFTFTGHHAANPDGLPATGSTPETNLWQFHSGISGSVIGRDTDGRAGITQRIPQFWTSGRLAVVKPSIILILLGTNDADNGIDFSNAPARMGTLIDTILAQPGAGAPCIFVGTIPPNLTKGGKCMASTREYNAALAKLIEERRSKGDDVTLVDLFTPLEKAGESARRDDLHPNAAGNRIMAEAWLQAIRSRFPNAPEK